MNILDEISRTLPQDFPPHYFMAGTPILVAFDCALLERETDTDFVYTAVNLKNGRSLVISRRKNPLSPSAVVAMVERMQQLPIAGGSRIQADRPHGEPLAEKNIREILDITFTSILPSYGYAVRQEQVFLAEHILRTISRRQISLSEAEVGTGKTLAYLVPAVLAKRGRLNDFWLAGSYKGMSFVDSRRMPIVVATSSITLQCALITDYIPELSRILLDHGVIKTPLTAVLRKGREHYVCDHNLRTQMLFETNPRIKSILEMLFQPLSTIDLAEVDGLTPHVKRLISVPGRCDENCPDKDCCNYLRFRSEAQSYGIDIQIVNHNYLLVDIMKRNEDSRPLIPNYQTLIIDEAHKFITAARSVYGMELSNLLIPEIKSGMFRLNFKREDARRLAQKWAKKLFDENVKLFRSLSESITRPDSEDETDRLTIDIGIDTVRHLRNIRDIADRLMELMDSESVYGRSSRLKSQIIWELTQARDKAAAFVRREGLITWLETEKNEILLCAISSNLDEWLFNDLWSRNIPTILTSGTLSVSGSFSRISQTLGLNFLKNRLEVVSKPSPFNYEKNAMLYISESMPFPDNRDNRYLMMLNDAIERLVCASHGHAAVLFTSYKVMDKVWERLSNRRLPYPLFRLDKGGVQEIEKFKRSGNGLLFAAGALWEGIDIPGDALSMLIIVRLPFQVPDPIGEYEQDLYPSFRAYRNNVIVPEMLMKLKQGFGRLIRMETDTGVVALLDSRAALRGAYRKQVLDALPNCQVTANINDINQFLKAKKTPEYWI